VNIYAPPMRTHFMLAGHELVETLRFLRNWDDLTNEECESLGVPLERKREPHIYTPKHDHGRDCCLYCGRPFQTYVDQPDTAERVRRQMQAIPFALPEKKEGQ
jgi:hypothetical protein